MSDESKVDRIEQLIKEGDFFSARCAAMELDPKQLSSEQASAYEKLMRALDSDGLINGTVLLLLLIWIGATVGAI